MQKDLFATVERLPTHRLFFALRPAAAECRAVEAVAASVRGTVPTAHWVRPSRHHLTLHYLGQSAGPRAEQVAQAGEAAGRVQGRAFMLALDRLAALGDRRRPALALAASVVPEPLRAFHAALGRQLLAAGLRSETGGSLLPHLTLAYVDPDSPLVPVAPVLLRPAGFQLVYSVDGQREYTVLGEWPFAA